MLEIEAEGETKTHHDVEIVATREPDAKQRLRDRDTERERPPPIAQPHYHRLLPPLKPTIPKSIIRSEPNHFQTNQFVFKIYDSGDGPRMLLQSLPSICSGRNMCMIYMYVYRYCHALGFVTQGVRGLD